MNNSVILELLDKNKIDSLYKSKPECKLSLLTAGSLIFPNAFNPISDKMEDKDGNIIEIEGGIGKENIIKYFVSEYNFKYKQEFSLISGTNYKYYHIEVSDNGKDVSDYFKTLEFVANGGCARLTKNDKTNTYYVSCKERVDQSNFNDNVLAVKEIAHYVLGDQLCSLVSKCIFLNHNFEEAFKLTTGKINHKDGSNIKYRNSYATHKRATRDRIIDNGLFYSGFDGDTMIPTVLTNQIVEMVNNMSDTGKIYLCKTMFAFHTNG